MEGILVSNQEKLAPYFDDEDGFNPNIIITRYLTRNGKNIKNSKGFFVYDGIPEIDENSLQVLLDKYDEIDGIESIVSRSDLEKQIEIAFKFNKFLSLANENPELYQKFEKIADENSQRVPLEYQLLLAANSLALAVGVSQGNFNPNVRLADVTDNSPTKTSWENDLNPHTTKYTSSTLPTPPDAPSGLGKPMPHGAQYQHPASVQAQIKEMQRPAQNSLTKISIALGTLIPLVSAAEPHAASSDKVTYESLKQSSLRHIDHVFDGGSEVMDSKTFDVDGKLHVVKATSGEMALVQFEMMKKMKLRCVEGIEPPTLVTVNLKVGDSVVENMIGQMRPLHPTLKSAQSLGIRAQEVISKNQDIIAKFLLLGVGDFINPNNLFIDPSSDKKNFYILDSDGFGLPRPPFSSDGVRTVSYFQMKKIIDSKEYEEAKQLKLDFLKECDQEIYSQHVAAFQRSEKFITDMHDIEEYKGEINGISWKDLNNEDESKVKRVFAAQYGGYNTYFGNVRAVDGSSINVNKYVSLVSQDVSPPNVNGQPLRTGQVGGGISYPVLAKERGGQYPLLTTDGDPIVRKIGKPSKLSSKPSAQNLKPQEQRDAGEF